MISWISIGGAVYQTQCGEFFAHVFKQGNSWTFTIDTPDQVCAYVYGDRYSENEPLRTANHAKHAAACQLISMMEES